MVRNLLMFGIFSKFTKIPIYSLIFRVSIIYAVLQCLFGNNIEWLFADTHSVITLNFLSRVRLIFNRETNKNVYYGKYNGTDVVIKEYSRGNECDSVDTKQCVDKYANFASSLQDAHMKSLVLCPTTQNVEIVVESLDEFRNLSFDSMTEPLLLKVILFLHLGRYLPTSCYVS